MARRILFDILLENNSEKSTIFYNYGSILNLLLNDSIGQFINKKTKVSRFSLSLSGDILEDEVERFKFLYASNSKNPIGIATLRISINKINWEKLNDREIKNFLIDKWVLLFSNLHEDYFTEDKYLILEQVKKLIDEEWVLYYEPIKKHLKYKNKTHRFLLEASVENTKFLLITEDDERILIKEYKTNMILVQCNFKGFNLNEDTLEIINKNMFVEPIIFDLKTINKY